MKSILSAAVLIVLAAHVAAPAQTQAPQQNSLSATMNVYVFPSKGQSASAQSKDEAECYQWAVKNTGTDPFELTKQAQAQQQQQQAQAQAAQGSGARGAARGAAGGALIGAIAGDAGTGAAVGAAAGALAGRARRRQAEAQAEQQTQSTQKATAQQMENFKKAFSVCLEAKHYMVKY
jgi:hypothetical protein